MHAYYTFEIIVYSPFGTKDRCLIFFFILISYFHLGKLRKTRISGVDKTHAYYVPEIVAYSILVAEVEI